MKRNDIKDLHTKSADELKKQLSDAYEALFQGKMEMSKHSLKDTRSVFWKRKEIAAVKTVLREKEMAEK